jgi:hypothetical protein
LVHHEVAKVRRKAPEKFPRVAHHGRRFGIRFLPKGGKVFGIKTSCSSCLHGESIPSEKSIRRAAQGVADVAAVEAGLADRAGLRSVPA